MGCLLSNDDTTNRRQDCEREHVSNVYVLSPVAPPVEETAIEDKGDNETTELKQVNQLSEWEMDRSSIKLLKKIGKGQFGEVWKGKWNNTTPVAVKTLKDQKSKKEAFLQEAKIMMEFRHEKLLTLHGVCVDGKEDDPVYIVTELMPNGCLLDYLRHQKEGKTMEIPTMVDILQQICCGMAYLENENLIHRDLAARNILVGNGYNVKIADFGLSRVLLEDAEYNSSGGKVPIKWTAPEALAFQTFSIKSDVWSFGILMIEVTTHGKVPYMSMSNDEVCTQVERGYKHPKPDDIPDDLYNVMLSCWELEPQQRPPFSLLAIFFGDYSPHQETVLQMNTSV